MYVQFLWMISYLLLWSSRPLLLFKHLLLKTQAPVSANRSPPLPKSIELRIGLSSDKSHVLLMNMIIKVLWVDGSFLSL